MKIMSFNTQHCLDYITKRIDFDTMADAIRRMGADVVGLQEMRGAGEHPDYTAQVEALAARTGMPYRVFAKAIDVPHDGPYGNGLLSRLPIEEAEVIPIPDPAPKAGVCYETRCILKARLVSGITVMVTHFGLDIDEQKNAVETVVRHLPAEKCVLMGDFNVTPDSPLLAPIRERMTDTADLFTSEKGSFPSDAPDRKIDYILVTPDLCTFSADIPAIVASDHRPYVAEIQ